MSCAVVVIGTSGRVITSRTVQVSQKETTIILPGHTSTARLTTSICASNDTVKVGPMVNIVCNPYLVTRTVVIPGNGSFHVRSCDLNAHPRLQERHK